MGSGADLVAGGDAFSLYLQARAEWSKRTPASIRDAIRLLDAAVSTNGSFALASAALADCYSILLDYGVMSPKEGLTRARLASGRALHKGPTTPEALASAALVRQMDLDWDAADEEFQVAIEAHPGYPVARQRYALFLAWMGRLSESRTQIDAARVLDPHSPTIASSAAWIDYYHGDFQAAARSSEEILARYPDFSSAVASLASAQILTGESAAAVSLLESSLAGGETLASQLALLSYAQARHGDMKYAETTLRRLRASEATRYVSPYYVALALVGLDRKGEALDALVRAEEERSTQLVHAAVEPLLNPLRSLPEFRNLLERLKLPWDAAVHPRDAAGKAKSVSASSRAAAGGAS